MRDFLTQRKHLRAYLDLHRSSRLIIVPEIGRGGTIDPRCLQAFRDLNKAMGSFHRIAEPITIRSQAGFTIDWMWGRLAGKSPTGERPVLTN